MLLLLFLLLPQIAQAQWHAAVGAQNDSKARQALAFPPNEMWIHKGDSITWAFNADEIHTLTFLKQDQQRPFFGDGCPGFTSDPATYDGSTCVTTPPYVKGQTFTVKFPTAGNFKITCLVHENMTGVVHVLPLARPLPHNQQFYDNEALCQQQVLLADRGYQNAGHCAATDPTDVAAGTGTVSATAGGSNTISVVRFIHDPPQIHAGQTVEWTNLDPILPHTITFGTEPQGDPVPPSSNVTVDKDGARHATVTAPSDSVHSGLIIGAPQERMGVPQAPLGVTRFRITFPNAGNYPYICALHDQLGMKGTVVVSP